MWKKCALPAEKIYRLVELTPWKRIRLEKLLVHRLVKKFFAFYGTVPFITAFTRADDFSLPWARLFRPTLSSCFLKVYFNINFPSTPRSSKWCFPSGVPWKPYVLLSSLQTCLMIYPLHFSSLYHPNNIWWGVQVMQLHFTQPLPPPPPPWLSLFLSPLFSSTFSQKIGKKYYFSVYSLLLLHKIWF